MHSRVSIRFCLSSSKLPPSNLHFHCYTVKPLNEVSAAANENVFILAFGLVSLTVRLSVPQAFGNSHLDTRRSHLSH